MLRSIFVAALLLAAPASSQRPTVTIIGTGSMASAMGPRVAAAGYPVVYGSRNPERPAVADLVDRTGAGTRALGQRQAAEAGDLVVLAVQWQVMQEVIDALGDLTGKVLLDFSSSEQPGADGYMEATVETSTSEIIQGWVPGASVVKTGVPSVYLMADPDLLGEPPTVMLAADDPGAKEAAGQLMFDIGLDPWDAGPLRNARAIAAFSSLFWVPLLQGRDQGIEVRLIRSSYWPCTWNVQEAYGAPADAGDLAQLPGQGEPLPCEAFTGR